MTQQEEEKSLEDRIKELESQLSDAQKSNTETRQTVIRVARKYAQIHGMCEVVDRAMEEAGLGPKLEKVELKLTAPIEIALEIDAAQVEGMSEENKKKHVAERLVTALTVNVDANRTGELVPQPISPDARRRHVAPQITIGSFELEGFGVIEGTAHTTGGWNAPAGYMARYSSNQGRVLHFFPEIPADSRNYVRAMCGEQETLGFRLVEQSARGEGRMCHRCERGAAAYR